ncbi:MAG: fumarylacetoacetate hydrolase family protein [Rubrivivax sp.]|nr:fumarylacetoacetate hydrolase family protein [Rubrivivax sp.]
MRWIRFRDPAGGARHAHVDGGFAQPVEGSPFGDWSDRGDAVALEAIDWLPPVRPSKVIALWKNFHALAVKQHQTIPAEPLYALRAPSSLSAHRQPVVKPASYDGAVFYEGELALVVGKTMRAVAPADVRAHLLGCTIANDVTAMELIARDPSFAQWSRAKSFDTFGVLGPWIDTDFDWTSASVHTRVNGRERQHYPLADMIFEPTELLSRLSHDMTLEPGDVVLCGTSVGSLPMRPGSEIEVEIDGLGVLANRYG